MLHFGRCFLVSENVKDLTAATQKKSAAYQPRPQKNCTLSNLNSTFYAQRVEQRQYLYGVSLPPKVRFVKHFCARDGIKPAGLPNVAFSQSQRARGINGRRTRYAGRKTQRAAGSVQSCSGSQCRTVGSTKNRLSCPVLSLFLAKASRSWRQPQNCLFRETQAGTIKDDLRTCLPRHQVSQSVRCTALVQPAYFASRTSAGIRGDSVRRLQAAKSIIGV